MNDRNPKPQVSEGLRAKLRWKDGWLLFDDPVDWIATSDSASVNGCLEAIESAVQGGLCAVGFIAFEAASAFDPALATHDQTKGLPLLGFGLFKAPAFVAGAQEAFNPAVSPEWFVEEGEGSTKQERYIAATEAIQAHIAAGDVYQVNYTFPFSVHQQSSSQSTQPEPGASSSSSGATTTAFADQLFEGLCAAQGGRFACALEAGSLQVVSASPELFFELKGSSIITQPMKGTAPRGRFGEEDRALAIGLEHSEKDRAENLMIVDMMRNDLGRIAKVASVSVPKLFEVERLPTLHQMTSTVEAQTNKGLGEIFAALFPCASITGAPKVTAIDAIRRLEAAPRGVYTGAVGMVLPADPDRLLAQEGPLPAAHPDDRYARFNVAIRTAWRTDSEHPFHYGVGSGIVADSNPQAEHQECLGKALGLTQKAPAFRLLETMLARPAGRATPRNGRVWLLNHHMNRLRASAEYFGFRLNEKALGDQLDAALKQHPDRSRLRLLLSRNGEVSIETHSESRMRARREPLRVQLATSPIDSTDPFLFHKTTHRKVYQDALTQAQERRPGDQPPIDDVLLFNEQGDLTESTIANLIVAPENPAYPWLTPRRTAGLLAGTLRQHLLDQGRIIEADLSLEDLVAAPHALLINSVRGFSRFELED